MVVRMGVRRSLQWHEDCWQVDFEPGLPWAPAGVCVPVNNVESFRGWFRAEARLASLVRVPS